MKELIIVISRFIVTRAVFLFVAAGGVEDNIRAGEAYNKSRVVLGLVKAKKTEI